MQLGWIALEALPLQKHHLYRAIRDDQIECECFAGLVQAPRWGGPPKRKQAAAREPYGATGGGNSIADCIHF